MTIIDRTVSHRNEVKMKCRLLSLGIFIATIGLLFGCGSHKAKVTIPDDFLLTDDIYLGQKISVLKDDHNITYDESSSTNIEYTRGSRYWNNIIYNYWSNSSRLESVRLTKGFSMKNMPYDSIAREYIDICTRYYGPEYIIIDYLYCNVLYGTELIWSLGDSAYVTFFYIPQILYEEKIQTAKVVDVSFQLTLMYELPEHYKNMKESTRFTRETLGLIP